MRRYFKQTKYKSFQRQLHIYGFRRIGKGSMDRGAYVHPMFIRHKKSMSLQMACIKIKGKKKSSNAVHSYRAAAVDQDFCCSETNMDYDQSQDRRDLTNVFLGDPILQVCTTTKENKKVSSSSNHHPDDEEPLANGALLFNQEVSGGLVDWMEQAQTILSRDHEEQVSPSVSEEGHHEALAVLHRGDRQKHFDEGLFEGKRFFDIVETTAEDFRAVVDRGGPMFYMPRSA